MGGQAVTERETAEGLPPIRVPSLVGREWELAALEQALAAPPAVVLIEGEAGIGKSRLVQEFLATPPGSRRRSLVARCPPFRQPCTLGPVVDAVRQAAGEVAELRLSALAGALRPLFPEWAAGLPPAPEPLEDASAVRYRLYRALAEVLDRLNAAVLVVEDVHWADEATLEFVLFLATRAQPGGPNLVVTYRPEDVPGGSLLRRLSSRLPAGTTCERITLGTLDVAETADLVSSMLPGGHVSQEFAAFLHAHTDGLPLAVEGSVRLLRDRRDLRCREGEWVRRSLDALAVPPTVRDAVLERVGGLGPDGAAVTRAAAVLAAPAPEAVLGAVAGLAEDRVRTGLCEALECGLLGENMPNGQGLVAIRHALAAQAVHDAIPAPERRAAHMRAGEALEGITPPPLARLARHFREADQTAKWCEYAEQAADLALASGDHKMAATLLHEVVANASLPAGAIAPLTRKVPLVALTHARLNDITRRLRSALDSGDLTPAEQAETGGELGRILIYDGELEAGAAELERAIPGLAHRPIDAAKAMLLLGWPRQTKWPASLHRRWLDRGAAMMADPSISAGDRMQLFIDHVTGLLILGEEAGWAVAAGLPRTAATPQEVRQIARGNLNLGDTAMLWGRYGEARQRLITALQLGRQHDYPRLSNNVLITLAHLDWFAGAWTGLAGRTAVLVELDQSAHLDAVLVAGLLDAASGPDRTAHDKLRLVLDEARRSGGVNLLLESSATLAELCLRDGRAEDALALTDEPMQVVSAKEIWLWATEVAPVRVRALAAAGRSADVAKLVMAFARGLSGRNAPAPRAALASCRAIQADAQGEADRAAILFGHAADAWQALPRPYNALLAREHQARCMLAADRTEAGLALLADACQGLSVLGASSDAERISRSLRERGVTAWHGWRGGRRGYGDQLSPRELDVVRLVVAGRTTREIAEELCRSPGTVYTQLKSAMRKFGVSTRAALAVRAAGVSVAEVSVAADHDAGASPAVMS